MAPRSVVTAKLSKFNVFSFITLSASVLAVLLINPSLIRRRCQCANKISSFNIFLKCECFKENEGLVTPWLFLLSATHLPFGQSVPIEVRPSSPSTHSSLLAFPVLFLKCYVCLYPFLSNPDKSQVGCIYSSSPAPTLLYCLVERVNKPVAVGTANLGGYLDHKFKDKIKFKMKKESKI